MTVPPKYNQKSSQAHLPKNTHTRALGEDKSEFLFFFCVFLDSDSDPLFGLSSFSVTTVLLDATARTQRREEEKKRRIEGKERALKVAELKERARRGGREGGREEMEGGMAVVISESVPDSH